MIDALEDLDDVQQVFTTWTSPMRPGPPSKKSSRRSTSGDGSSPLLVMGVDPGTAITGYGIVQVDDSVTAVAYGAIRTSAGSPFPSTAAHSS